MSHGRVNTVVCRALGYFGKLETVKKTKSKKNTYQVNVVCERKTEKDTRKEDVFINSFFNVGKEK